MVLFLRLRIIFFFGLITEFALLHFCLETGTSDFCILNTSHVVEGENDRSDDSIISKHFSGGKINQQTPLSGGGKKKKKKIKFKKKPGIEHFWTSF